MTLGFINKVKINAAILGRSLPSTQDVIIIAHQRISSLEKIGEERDCLSEEKEVKIEIKKLHELINLIKNKEDIIISYNFLFNILQQTKRVLESCFEYKELLARDEVEKYNTALYHYNEFCNIIESLI